MSRKIIFTVILIILILGTGFVWYYYLPKPTPSLETNGRQAVAAQPVGTRLIELRRLKTLELDVSILRDKSFGTLNYTGEVLPAEEVSAAGRVNPFLPF